MTDPTTETTSDISVSPNKGTYMKWQTNHKKCADS